MIAHMNDPQMSSDSTWFQRSMQTIVRMGRPDSDASTQRSTNPLREVFSDLISYLIFFDMTCGKTPLSLQEFRDTVVDLVNAQEGRARALGVSEESFKQARFAVLSWVDETVFNSNWPHRAEWQYLMLTYYRTSNAGEEFFQHLDRLRPQDNQIREIYYLCLSLGFQGKYAFSSEQQGLKDIKRALYKQLASTSGDIRQSYQRLFPEAYVKVEAAPPPKKPGAWLYYVAALAVPLVLAGVLWWMLRSQSESIVAQLGTAPPLSLPHCVLVDELRQKSLRAVDEPEAVRITLESLSFPISGTTPSPQAEAKIGEISAILKRCGAEKKIVVEGHASRERDTDEEKNLRLSQERAETVRQAFLRLGFPRDRISAIGYGTSRPTSRDEAKNRRVEIVVAK